MKTSVEYIFGCVGPNEYTVTKFEDGVADVAQMYSVNLNKQSMPCTCPAWHSGKTRPCKHARMVQQYVAAGEPELGDYRCIGVGRDWVFSHNKEQPR